MEPNLVKFIDREALKDNANLMKKHNYPAKLCAVVKANGYGHGLLEISQLLSPYVDYFATYSASEALQIVLKVDKPVLIIEPFCEKDLATAIEQNIHISVNCKENVLKIEEIAQKSTKICKIHIKIDTGMHRLGVNNTREFCEIVDYITHSLHLELAGVFTHIGDSEHPKGKRTQQQLDRFSKFCCGNNAALKHFASSAVACTIPLSADSMARVGIALYGYGPLKGLQPVLSVFAQVVAIAHAERGEYIGYGNRHRAKRKTRIAVLNIGYAEGLMRCYAQKGFVILRNKKAKICANICMDMTLVDVTDIPEVQVGDWAIVLGSSLSHRITAADIAKKCSTIEYEILTNFRDIENISQKPI